VDRQGLVYVADSSNQRIQVLSANGQSISQWGWEGTDPGLFELPSSVAVDPSGNVLVTDTRNGRIQKLSASGQPVAVWGEAAGGVVGALIGAAALVWPARPTWLGGGTLVAAWLMLAALAIGALVATIRRPTIQRAARAADRQLHTHSRLATAAEVLEGRLGG